MMLKLVEVPTFPWWTLQVSCVVWCRLGFFLWWLQGFLFPALIVVYHFLFPVMPKKGSALLWPSVLDENPDEKDVRTSHQALKVEAGIKYGANAWYHQRNFKEPNLNGCQ
jgi:hypothetical protein